MSNQTTKNQSNNRGEEEQKRLLRSIWLGRRDSNPRMPGPKPGALPLGHAPIARLNRLDFSVIGVFSQLWRGLVD